MNQAKWFDEVVRITSSNRQKLAPLWTELERLAHKHPAKMALLFYEDVIYWRRVYRRRHRKVLKRVKRSDTWELDEELEALWATMDYWLEEATAQMMDLALRKAKRAGEDNLLFAACMGYIAARREAENVLARVEPRVASPETRKLLVAMLTGYVGARISLVHGKRLATVMGEENTDPRERLRRELPGAVMDGWGETRNSNIPLLSRVDRLLSKTGSESARLARDGKLAETLSSSENMLGGSDEDLAEFERQETLRQELKRLEGWIKSAKFSEREAQVYELDMQMDYDTAAIARKLSIDTSTVRQYRKRYQDKVRKAAGF